MSLAVHQDGKDQYYHTKPTDELTESDFVCISVSGMKYETLTSTLKRFPCTLLADKKRRKKYYNESKNAFFFDRNRESFDAILYYYQSGYLLRPPNIPMRLFAADVSFFDLGDDVLAKLREDEGYVEEKIELPENELQRKIWQLFEFPDSSMMARILAAWSVVVITVSITVFCMETMPMFDPKKVSRITLRNGTHNSTYNMSEYMNQTTNNRTYNATITQTVDDGSRQLWFSLELGCIVWFTIEYLVRLLSSPNKWKFVSNFLNVIDLLAILPYFVTMAIAESGDTTPLSVLRLVRLVRVFRIFKLSRHSLGLQILGHTLKASLSELMMLVFFLFVGIILFSSGIYYAERKGPGEEGMFTSIPDAFWYSLVTMTTVGYGDKVPKTFEGKLIGSLCVLCGVLTIALPAPVIVSNFEFFYKRDRMNHDESIDEYLDGCIQTFPHSPNEERKIIEHHGSTNDRLTSAFG